MAEPASYEGLPGSYWTGQVQRVAALRDRIRDRNTTTPGRVVPADADLVIGTGRRLDAAVMFIDIVGFSNRRSITADEQEMILRVLNLFMTEMIRIIEEYGGHVEKNTGDGLLAYFEEGGSTSETNSTKRAVACALTMLTTNEFLIAPVLRASGVVPLEFRTTIEYGGITVARIGAPQRFNANVAIGNVANFASKMLALVAPAQIGLGANARDRLPVLWSLYWVLDSGVATGWCHGDTSVPYPLYLYTGRWAKLV
jgi:class 3 adenylate cyclase